MMIDLVKYPVLTEKSVRLSENNQYTFDVEPKLNKIQIKKLIESLFEVKVIAVNTHRPPRKKKRLGISQGYRSRYKRVIITIKSGESIPGFPKNEKESQIQ
jgi:large subunit ribosomal protein L23